MSSSKAQLIASLPEAERDAIFLKMSPAEQEALLFDWDFWSRPEQRAPKFNPNSKDGSWRTWLLTAGRGFGKALDNQTPIPTPQGWTTIGELSIGDSVFDENGRACHVTAKFEPEAERQYRLTFSDGATIDACGDHLWITWNQAARKAFGRSPYEDTSRFPDNWPSWRLKRVSTGGKPVPVDVIERAAALKSAGVSVRQIAKTIGSCRIALGRYLDGKKLGQQRIDVGSPGPQIRTTEEIRGSLTSGSRGDTNHCIPCARPLDLLERELPIRPYSLGVWLGDGGSKDASITCHEDDMAETRGRIEDDGYPTRDRKDTQCFGVSLLHTLLRNANLLKNKHVPEIYLRASIGQRLALLRGLMDTDGNIEGGNTVAFVNTNKRLVDAVEELVVSLGMKAKILTAIGVCNGKVGKRYWRVQFTPTVNPFSLARKADRIRIGGNQSLRNHHRMIVAVEPIDWTPMSCITVDSPNSMFLAGRAMIPTHNTRTAAEWVRGEIESGRRRNMGLIGPNKSDVRKIMVEGPSGILAVCPPWNLPTFEPTNDRVVWPNGATCHVFSAEEPERLRGPNLDGLWMDELCSWGNADHIKAVYEMASFCLRIKGPLGHPPAEIITTTPKPSPILRQIMKEPKTVNIGGSTFDNLDNLDESMLDFLRKKYEGTRLGRQELYGVVLESFEGALWTPEQFDIDRLSLTGGDCWRIATGGNSGIPHLIGPKGEMIYFKRIVVSIDPAGSANRKSNETGIITAALGEDEQGYLLRDKSGIYSPDQWAQIAVEEYHFWDADRVLAEQNYGGDMVKSTILAQDANVPVRMMVASKGKRVRAEPVSALYEQHRVHHVGVFPKAEDQMVTWDPFGTGDSPDRLDAIVWAFQDLMLKKPTRVGANGNGYRGPISIYQR